MWLWKRTSGSRAFRDGRGDGGDSPAVLHGEVAADHTAHALIGAARGCVQREQALGGQGKPEAAEAKHLQHAADGVHGLWFGLP